MSWRKTSGDFPASDGWSGKYRLSGPAQIDVNGTVDVDDYLFTISSSSSMSIAAGTYTFAGWVEKGTGATKEKHTLWSGTVTVSPDLSAQKGVTDNRSQIRRTLQKIE